MAIEILPLEHIFEIPITGEKFDQSFHPQLKWWGIFGKSFSKLHLCGALLALF
jgi:hypothetical protein